MRPDSRAWWALAILCFVYVLNFLDRQLLSILAKPIQDELGVTDGQLGLISGLYFALFYCLLAIPVGWLADRTNRVRVLVARLRAVERGDRRLRPGVQLPPAGGCADVGRRRRGRRRAAVLRHHLRLLPARHARHRARPLQPRPADRRRRSASPSAPRSRRPTAGARRSCRSASVGIVDGDRVWLFVREPVRGGSGCARCAARPTRRARRRSGRPAACSSRDPVLLRVSLACGATQFVTYAVLNFTTLFLMREKGMTLQRGRDLLRAAHRHLGLRAGCTSPAA